ERARLRQLAALEIGIATPSASPRGEHVVGPVLLAVPARAGLLAALPVAGEQGAPELLSELQQRAHQLPLLLEPGLHPRPQPIGIHSYSTFLRSAVRLAGGLRCCQGFSR